MLRTVLIAILFLGTSVALTHADGGRVALVVGVSKYEHAASLPNTLNDAKDMSAALKRLGFDVETILDPSRSELEAAVRRYGDGSVGAEASVFYYSGHALEAGGHNWILPATANINSERDLRFEAIDLNSILEQTDGTAKVAIAFLDACRDNPFAGRVSASGRSMSRGLERVELSTSGVLVAFSTAPGQIALDGVSAKKNSPFTAALLSHLETAGLEVKSLLARVTKDVVEETKGKQRPWQNSSLEGDFYFLPPVATTSTPLAQSATNIEAIFWDSIKASRNPADFEVYLAKYPKGIFVELAQNQLAVLQQETSAKPPTIQSQTADLIPAVSQDKPTAPAEVAPAVPPAKPLITSADREAARLYKLSADKGNASAQVNLGFFYEQGRGGLPKDDHEAAHYFKLAADQGNAQAQSNLGFFYREGRGGLPKDDREAARLFKLSAKQGNSDGQRNLGFFYREGRGGLPKDDREAAPLFKLSADQANASGQDLLGNFYEQGRGGLTKDDREAARLYKLSADQGNADGQNNLGMFYRFGRGGLPQDDREAVRLFKLSADQGNADGQKTLGFFYREGRGGLPQDDREAARLFKLSADQGNQFGQVLLGNFYEQGRGGLPQDDREATRLYKLAADRGNAEAQNDLANLFREGRAGPPTKDMGSR